MTGAVPPPVGSDWKVWARQISDFVRRNLVKLQFRNGVNVATEDGIILWDEENGYPVVSKDGAYVPIILGDAMRLSQFGETISTQRTPLIELNSSYGLSAFRDVQTVTGTGSIASASTGEYALATGTTASSTARLDSAERIRYMPGYSAEVGLGVRIPTPPTGNQFAKWGIRSSDATEGFYWGVDATGVFTAILRNNIETKTYLSSASIDKLDGTGASRLTLDLSDGNIFQIDYTWYGYGQILFQVVDVVGSQQKIIPVNSFKPSGATSIQTPNLPIFVEVSNGGDASDFQVFVGGRQASVLGQYNPLFRSTGQESGSVSTSTTTVPLVSFRSKSGFQDRNLRIDSANAIVASEDHIIEFYLNPTLTGASFTTPTNATASETSLEVDVSATALSGGTLLFSYYANSGLANRTAANAISKDFNVPEGQTLTMAARTVSGTGTARGFLTMQEEW